MYLISIDVYLLQIYCWKANRSVDVHCIEYKTMFLVSAPFRIFTYQFRSSTWLPFILVALRLIIEIWKYAGSTTDVNNCIPKL
jgi:hypothetical protein